MIKFFHKLFNPHCADCRAEEIDKELSNHEARTCKSCETLRLQLDIANYEKKDLLNRLLNPIREEVTESIEFKEVPKQIPFHVRKAQLEQASRIRAAEIRHEEQLRASAPKPEIAKVLDDLDTDY